MHVANVWGVVCQTHHLALSLVPLSHDEQNNNKNDAAPAAAIARTFPALQFRVMLVGLPALGLASSVGISEFNCFAVEALKGSLMGSLARCPGFSTLALNMLLPDLPDPADGFAAGLPAGSARCSPWLHEYARGCRLEPYGLLPGRALVGLTFRAAAVAASARGVRFFHWLSLRRSLRLSLWLPPPDLQ